MSVLETVPIAISFPSQMFHVGEIELHKAHRLPPDGVFSLRLRLPLAATGLTSINIIDSAVMNPSTASLHVLLELGVTYLYNSLHCCVQCLKPLSINTSQEVMQMTRSCTCDDTPSLKINHKTGSHDINPLSLKPVAGTASGSALTMTQLGCAAIPLDGSNHNATVSGFAANVSSSASSSSASSQHSLQTSMLMTGSGVNEVHFSALVPSGVFQFKLAPGSSRTGATCGVVGRTMLVLEQQHPIGYSGRYLQAHTATSTFTLLGKMAKHRRQHHDISA